MNNLFNPNLIGARITGILISGAWRETNGKIIAVTSNNEGDIFVFVNIENAIYKRDITSVKIDFGY